MKRKTLIAFVLVALMASAVILIGMQGKVHSVDQPFASDVKPPEVVDRTDVTTENDIKEKDDVVKAKYVKEKAKSKDKNVKLRDDTESISTEKNETSAPVNKQAAITEITTTEQITTEQTTTEQTTTEQTVNQTSAEQLITEQQTTEQAITEQSLSETDTSEQTSTEQTVVESTERQKVWHEPVTEQVWVVDHEAWTETWEEPATEYHDVCNYCGAIIDGKGSEHLSESWLKVVNGEISREELCYGYRTDVAFDVIVTKTLEHPEEGHYETVVIKEGYWE